MSAVETKSNPVFKRLLLIFTSLLLVAACVLGAKIALTGEPQLLAGTRPTNLGVHAGQLAPCPSTLNCVNSQSSDAAHRIELLLTTPPHEKQWLTSRQRFSLSEE
jgi:hypothetical protein